MLSCSAQLHCSASQILSKADSPRGMLWQWWAASKIHKDSMCFSFGVSMIVSRTYTLHITNNMPMFIFDYIRVINKNLL